MSIVFAGTPQIAAQSLTSLVKAGAPITLVITRPDAPVGRKQILTPSPVAKAAEELGLPLIKTNAISSQVIDRLLQEKISFGIVLAYGVILREPALSALPNGWFNVHFSLLPKLRGAAPVQRALVNGETETGVSVFKIDAGLDTGDIAGAVPTHIEPTEDSFSLLNRLGDLGVSLLLETIPKVESGFLELSPQNNVGVSFASKITRQEAELSFSKPAFVLENLVRGASPEPGAWTKVSSSADLKVFTVRAHQALGLDIGQCSLVAGRVLVGCVQGSLELLEVQPAGKKRMNALDWYRGLNSKVILGMDV